MPPGKSRVRFVLLDPPGPPGFISFRHAHGGFGEFCLESRLRLPTLDVFHAATALLEAGFEAEVVDATILGLGLEACAAEVLRRGPTHVAVRSGGFSLEQDLEAARLVRRGFGGPILFFGPAAACAAPEVLASGAADGAAAGEATPVFLEIARRGAFEGVPGLLTVAAPASVGAGIGQAGRALGPAGRWGMDRPPVPRWDLVPFERYSYVTSQASWGCPRLCGYCPYPLTQGTRQRRRPVESVVDEFRTLRRRHGLRFVQLRDPDFALDRAWTGRLCRALIKAGAPITWACDARLDTVDDGLADLLAAAGCLRVAFGVESINPASLRAMGRAFLRPDDIRRGVARLKSRGILAYALFVLGLPGETRRTTEDLIDFALGLGTEAASFSMAMPLPGTALERLARERGWFAPRGAVEALRLTSCVPSMRNESMTKDEIGALHGRAKRLWKERKAGKEALAVS